MRTPPISDKEYRGVTIILSNPSRFDKKKLLSGNAGYWFEQTCLLPSNMLLQWCDIRTIDCRAPIKKNTKAILLCGQKAMREFTGGKYNDYLLQEQRGYLLDHNNYDQYPVIASYLPQDCLDIQNYEKKFNPLSEDWEENKTEFSEESKTAEVSEKRHHGKTLRKNYRFWLARDCKKLLNLRKVWPDREELIPKFQYNIAPPSEDVIQKLRSISKSEYLYLDIETDDNTELTCFAFSLGNDKDKEVYVVPIKRYNGSVAYSEWIDILRALNYALRKGVPVCHNSMFDLFVLSYRYGIHFPRDCYDTMLAHHRLYPEVEKSLGHCISHLCFFERYHKDQGIFNPQNITQERMLWEYNGKDVSSMMLVKDAIESEALKVYGSSQSIDQANKMIYPFLIMTLTGIRYDEDKRKELITENDYLMERYLKCMEHLVGRPFIPSNKQAREYFEYDMGYKPQEKSKQTGASSWNEAALRKLKLHIEGDGKKRNPVIDFCLRYRTVQKETSMLKFRPWKENNTNETN